MTYEVNRVMAVAAATGRIGCVLLVSSKVERCKMLRRSGLKSGIAAQYARVWIQDMNPEALGMPLDGSKAAYAHNMGATRYRDFLNGTNLPLPKERIAKRSKGYQYAIGKALQGHITLKPDDWDKYYPGRPYNGLQYRYEQ